MSSRTLTQLLLRVWGVIVVVSALGSLGSVALTLIEGSPTGIPTSAFHSLIRSNALLAAFEVVLGLLLIVLAVPLSAALVPDPGTSPLQLSSEHLLNVAIVVLGLVQLATGLQNAARIAVLLAVKPSFDQVPYPEYAWRNNPEALVTAVVSLVVGVLLLLFRSRLASTLGRGLARPAAAHPASEENGAA